MKKFIAMILCVMLVTGMLVAPSYAGVGNFVNYGEPATKVNYAVTSNGELFIFGEQRPSEGQKCTVPSSWSDNGYLADNGTVSTIYVCGTGMPSTALDGFADVTICYDYKVPHDPNNWGATHVKACVVQGTDKSWSNAIESATHYEILDGKTLTITAPGSNLNKDSNLEWGSYLPCVKDAVLTKGTSRISSGVFNVMPNLSSITINGNVAIDADAFSNMVNPLTVNLTNYNSGSVANEPWGAKDIKIIYKDKVVSYSGGGQQSNTYGYGNTQLTLNQEAAVMSISIPANIPVVVKSDVTVIAPDTVTVTNSSKFTVTIDSMTVTPKNGWAAVEILNKKQIGGNDFKFGYTVPGNTRIYPETGCAVAFNIDVGPRAKTENVDIANFVFTVSPSIDTSKYY